MSTRVHYEWAVELTTTVETAEHEVDEVLDVHHFDDYAGAVDLARGLAEDGTEWRIVLVRNDSVGRSWAYMEDNALPRSFKDAYGRNVALIPQRFHKEVAPTVNGEAVACWIDAKDLAEKLPARGVAHVGDRPRTGDVPLYLHPAPQADLARLVETAKEISDWPDDYLRAYSVPLAEEAANLREALIPYTTPKGATNGRK